MGRWLCDDIHVVVEVVGVGIGVSVLGVCVGIDVHVVVAVVVDVEGGHDEREGTGKVMVSDEEGLTWAPGIAHEGIRTASMVATPWSRSRPSPKVLSTMWLIVQRQE